jgi:hypothetical protein
LMKSTIRTLERLLANTVALEEQVKKDYRPGDNVKLYGHIAGAREQLLQALETAQGLRR